MGKQFTGDQAAGLHHAKFKVERTDGSSGPGGKHEHCWSFVLDLQHDPFAVPALKAYIEACRADYPHLAADLEKVLAKRQAACCERDYDNDGNCDRHPPSHPWPPTHNVPGFITRENVLSRIMPVFDWIEKRGMRVGAIWLNPVDAAHLAYHPGAFDGLSDPRVQRHFYDTWGGILVGHLLGANVFTADVVPLGHIAVAPEGFVGKIVDRSATMPF